MRAVANSNEELRGVFTVDWNQPAPDGSGRPLIPNEVVPALEQALADWKAELGRFEWNRRESPDAVYADQVVRVLGGHSLNPSHVSRVVHGLRRLARAGRVVYLRPKDRRAAGKVGACVARSARSRSWLAFHAPSQPDPERRRKMEEAAWRDTRAPSD